MVEDTASFFAFVTGEDFRSASLLTFSAANNRVGGKVQLI